MNMDKPVIQEISNRISQLDIKRGGQINLFQELNNLEGKNQEKYQLTPRNAKQ